MVGNQWTTNKIASKIIWDKHNFERTIVNMFLPISFNIRFGLNIFH